MTGPGKILVIQLRRIGDVILTTPALAALKKRYPAAAIDFLTEPPGSEALEGNPHLHDIVVYKSSGLFGAVSWIRRIRAVGYDWVIDYMGNPRSALITAFSRASVRAGPARAAHRWAYNHPLPQPETLCYVGLEKMLVLKSLGVTAQGTDFMPKVYLSPPPLGGRNLIGLVPASRKITRRWPAQSYARLGRLLRDKYGCEIVVFWGPGEKSLAAEVAALIGSGARPSPETPGLKDVSKLMSECRLIVTNCNGPKHLAVAMGIPTLTIHGSSDPGSWNPPHPRHASVRFDELFCIGCGLNRCPYELQCMTQLEPERVFAAAAALLDKTTAEVKP